MKISAQQWLTDRALLPGILACGLRSPQGNLVCNSPGELFPADQVEQLLGHYDTLRAGLFSDKLAPRWSTWTFEQGQIRFVARPDGWLLGLIVHSETDIRSALDSLSEEFLSLQLDK